MENIRVVKERQKIAREGNKWKRKKDMYYARRKTCHVRKQKIELEECKQGKKEGEENF